MNRGSQASTRGTSAPPPRFSPIDKTHIFYCPSTFLERLQAYEYSPWADDMDTDSCKDRRCSLSLDPTQKLLSNSPTPACSTQCARALTFSGYPLCQFQLVLLEVHNHAVTNLAQ
ncbi:hypothetical protein AcW1_009999 [Taiwanofungus camphoratus]|nr:hypothetical protein AcW1_009999 [Antrodia cinnamomea]